MAKESKETKSATTANTSTRVVAVDPVKKLMAETGCSKLEAIAKVASEKATDPPTE